MRIKRLRELMKGQIVQVKYVNPEVDLSDEELDEPEEIIMLLMVEKICQATTQWERGTMEIGDWVADLNPIVRTEIEDHLQPAGSLPGLSMNMITTTALTEMFGMEVHEEILEDLEELQGDAWLYFVWGPGVETEVEIEVLEMEKT